MAGVHFKEVADFVDWVTPRFGDSTYSLLRGHLKFEQLLNSYFDRVLPHPRQLDKARLSFSQKLAIARSICTTMPPTDWAWSALEKLNKIRNMLAHDPGEKVRTEINAYVEFCVQGFDDPLPVTDEADVKREVANGKHLFTAADVVTVGLYGHMSGRLGLLGAPLPKPEVAKSGADTNQK